MWLGFYKNEAYILFYAKKGIFEGYNNVTLVGLDANCRLLGGYVVDDVHNVLDIMNNYDTIYNQQNGETIKVSDLF